MQQRKIHLYGEEKKVYLTTFDDKQCKVVKLNELEGGNWEVRFLDKDHITRIIPTSRIRADLYPVALWKNYSDALDFLPPEYNRGLRPLWNTVCVTAMVILGTILSSSLVAFSFARLRWPGRDLLFVIMLATMMIPGAVTMLPVFLIFRSLGWIDTLRPLWVPAFFGAGFNIFLLRQFFLTIPNDLEDAAKIDGCSYFTIYWKIMLPLIKPALAALTIFAFMGSWNNFMGPLIYISSPEKMTLAYALQLFQGMHGGEPAMMMASATLVMIPVLIVFFFTQRYMIQGVTLTGIKG
jgi:multiple sugar transport system permease protein